MSPEEAEVWEGYEWWLGQSASNNFIAIETAGNYRREISGNFAMQWKVYPKDCRYEVSACGLVRRIFDNGLPPQVCPIYINGGYPAVTIGKNTTHLHRILCQTFHGEPPKRSYYAAHRNDLKGDYTLINVYWASPSQNAFDRERNKRLR